MPLICNWLTGSGTIALRLKEIQRTGRVTDPDARFAEFAGQAFLPARSAPEISSGRVIAEAKRSPVCVAVERCRLVDPQGGGGARSSDAKQGPRRQVIWGGSD